MKCPEWLGLLECSVFYFPSEYTTAFPILWFCLNITVKFDDTTDPANYRPISTLSSFRKVFEKLIYNQLYRFLEKYSILYKYQFGFSKGYSTEQAILEITDSLKKFVTYGLFLDFSKVFYTINNDILLSKL